MGSHGDTVLVVLSDNGGSPDVAGSSWPLRGSRGDLFDGGARGSLRAMSFSAFSVDGTPGLGAAAPRDARNAGAPRWGRARRRLASAWVDR